LPLLKVLFYYSSILNHSIKNVEHKQILLFHLLN
jgi:hypothetical protein